MSGRKRSGAQNRKRKKEAEIAFKKSSVLLAAFLKKAKKEVEAANTSSSESEDGGYQPSVLEHDVDANVENIAVSEKNFIQTDISVCAERNSENTEDRETQHSDEPVESNGEDNISGREAEIIILITMCNRMWFRVNRVTLNFRFSYSVMLPRTCIKSYDHANILAVINLYLYSGKKNKKTI